MASAQNPAANADLFDVYFRRADLDHDGRISGVEAVSFFQGSGLSKHVLAQIWAYADQRQTGFLGRAEFYNALKLVTVAQSKRQLTPEMVKAALYGPAAAKIPPPQINLAATPAPQPQPNSTTSASAAHSTAVAPMSQNLGYGGPQGNVNMNQQHLMKPPLPTSASASQLTHGLASQGVPRGGAMGGPRPPTSNMSNDWAAGRTGGAPSGTSSQIPNKGISPSMAMDGFGLTTSGSTASLPPRPQTVSGMNPSGPQTKDTKEISGNGFASGSIFGGDAFSATPSQPNQDSSSHAFSVSNTPVSSAVVPHSVGTPSVRPTSLDSLQSSLMTQIAGGQLQQDQSLVKHSQDASAQTTSTYATAGVSVRAENSASGQSQMTWPKISPTDVQKYTKVFVEVDTDRDGKITGEQARNLFLSWRLPREVLKQVWDLSDQDNDSMLSLREFCVAVYLMERYREGCSLPAALPRNILFDLSSVLQSTTNYGNSVSAAWRPSFGSHQQQQQGMPGPGARHVLHAAGPRPPLPVATPRAVEGRTDPPKSKVPVLEKHLVNQLSTEEQNVLNSKLQEVTEADKKVDELEKEILDSKEKIEFYRTKMQELVLYKSRCDNRLNEIVERTSADKREVESLSRKYEEKYKQGGDVASKLIIEEATFRDIQEKKMELYQAIVKMEQDGGTDGVLQVGVDRIQSELDELVKSLNERCKKYGLRGKPTTLTELPFGWQPGIQHGAADWDEDWDKFEDEGFTCVKELTLDVQNVLAPPKQKSKLVQNEEASAVESPAAVSTPNGDVKSVDPHTVNKSDGHIVDKSDDPHNGDERIVENGSAYNKSEEESAKSAPNSPFSSSAVGSPSREFQYSNRGKSIVADTSPRNKENQSDHGGTSVFSGDKSFDEAPWGTFDANDDINSVWDFNSVSSLKDTDHERNNDNYYFGSGEFGLNPIKTGSSSQSGSIAQSSRPFSFDDSVPSTPLYNFSNSPPRYKEGSEPSFDSFSRFDSFSTHDGGPFQQREAFSRFDSMRSSRDFDQSHGFPSFDDFGASGPFKSSLETPRSGFDSLAETPRRGFENWGETPRASDNWGETSRRSSDTWSETPRKGSENWSAF